MSEKMESPFLKPMPGLRVIEGSPAIRRPTKEEIESYPAEAKNIIEQIILSQKNTLKNKSFDFKSLKGKHFLLAGATGSGLGGALALACLDVIKESGSIFVISRDLKKSLGYETGHYLEQKAKDMGLVSRFQWSNDGLALEGDKFDSIVNTLKELGADKVIYVNTVASASSGILPGYPPVYVKDVDEQGLFQWQLSPLDDKSIETTKLFMGTMAVDFPKILEKAGIEVELTVYADWRGSLDHISRDPSSSAYGRQGAYSTSLFLPKDIIQNDASSAYGTNKKVIDIFYPVMRTRALGFIPGGITMASIFAKLMEQSNVQYVDVPELALETLICIDKKLKGIDENPFPRLDQHEMEFDLWFFEVLKRLNDKQNDQFYFKKWINK